MSRYPEFDPTRLEHLPFAQIEHTVSSGQFAGPPRSGASFREFWDSLPAILAADRIRRVAAEIATARTRRRAVIAACGGHVVKCGLAPVLITLMHEGFITALAMNGATAIHDLEIAFFGTTSERVDIGLPRGEFGMASETSERFNRALSSASDAQEGAGEALGRHICEEGAPNGELSLLGSAYMLGIPVTVHVAIGTDIVHMHADADGSAIGSATLRDFRILTAAMASLSGGGVLLNIGSAVLLPEVLLKAMACLRNTGPEFTNFLGVNLDMVQQYRSNEQVISRVKAIGGDGISLTGHHELMLPLLAYAVLEESNG